MRGQQLPGCLDAEAVVEDRGHRLDLHLAEAGQREQVGPQLVCVGRLLPHAGRVAAVAIEHVRGQLVHPPGHRPREPMQSRLGGKHRLEVGVGQDPGID